MRTLFPVKVAETGRLAKQEGQESTEKKPKKQANDGASWLGSSGKSGGLGVRSTVF